MIAVNDEDNDVLGAVALRFNGDKRHPERRGFIPGVTSREDGQAGLMPGDLIHCTDELLARLNRPLGRQGQEDFAQFIAGVYNANLKDPKWSVVLVSPTHAAEPEHVQSVREPEDTKGQPVVDNVVAADAPSVEEEET